ncbi:Gamma-tubulin complex component 6 [Triplophysa tibetana]|uniref:Gamma-tubulin complex component 6 n=1 Tax=Triplophysa tibetana TaxID=1572043 RepID=A0A5A9PRX4_9TELE|nr:Gamma-tubulin complex component 6 [Triplophysa tibetana]
MSSCHSNSGSITELLGSLCDCSLSGLSWKRRAHGAVSREGVRRILRRRAYGVLLAGLFQDGAPIPAPNALANTPARNKILMISFDLRVSGREEEAERLEELLEQLYDGVDASGLSELNSVLELLVQLAGSEAPPPLSFSRDYMRRDRPVLRRPPLGGYLSKDMQRLEERAWSLICREEWGVYGGVCRTLDIMDAPPGIGLLGLGRRAETEEKFERETRLSLFGALQHSRTTDMDIRLDLPPVPSNADITGLSIRVPSCLDQSEDEGFQSATNLTPDSQSEPSPGPEIDVWEALRTYVPGRRRCWENIGCPPGQTDSPYLTEAGREAFDQLYRLWEGEMRNVLSTQTPSPLLPLPLDCQSQLVKDVLNVLIGVASATFPLNEGSVQFDVRPDICVSGTSPESVSRLLSELAQYGTHYLRLSRFSLSGGSKKGLVFQSVRVEHSILSESPNHRVSLPQTGPSAQVYISSVPKCRIFHLKDVCRCFSRCSNECLLSIRYLSELCCVDGVAGVGRATFPAGVKLLSCLYNEAQSNCSNENHPVLLSLLKSSCEPYTRQEFLDAGLHSHLTRRGGLRACLSQTHRQRRLCLRKNHQPAKDLLPTGTRNLEFKHTPLDRARQIQTLLTLKVKRKVKHYIFWSDVPVPRIAVTFSLEEVVKIERECAVYRGRMETIAKHSAISREEKAIRTEQARQELINQVMQTAAKTLERIRGHQVSQRLAEEAQKRERFEEMKQQLELNQEVINMINTSVEVDANRSRFLTMPMRFQWRSTANRRELEDDFSYARELRDREQRLQALEEQLERRARMDLIAQYSQLSEAAARRELRAMWKVQRIKLDELRVNFLEQDQLNFQLPEQMNQTQTTKDAAIPESSAHPCPPAIGGVDALKSEEIDISDFLPKPQPAPDSGAMTQSLQDIGSDLPESIRGSVSHPQNSDHVAPHPSDSHISVGENVSDVQESFPTPNLHGQASKSSFPLGNFAPEVLVGQPKASIHGHPSQSSVQLSDHPTSGQDKGTIRLDSNARAIEEKACDAKSNRQNTEEPPTGYEARTELVEASTGSEPKQAAQEPTEEAKSCDSVSQPSHSSQPEEKQSVPPLISFHDLEFDLHMKNNSADPTMIASQPSLDVHRHASDAHIRVGEHVSEVSSPMPTPNIHGHASDAHIKVGEHMSEETAHVPTHNIYGHASDAHIKVGEHMSEETTHVPTPNIHGHASDAHIRVGEHMSEETAHVPTHNIHGHASDAHIKVGEYMSEETTHVPTPNIHGHASDAHIKVGEHMSEETAHVPTHNIHGHASDAHIKVGEYMSEETTHVPTPNIHGHASDAHIRVGEHMSEETAHVPTPNIHGHASDAHIKVGEHMSEETARVPTHNIHGHASDAHIKVGEHMSEETTHVPTPNIHGHASDAHIIVGEHMSEETAHVPTPNIHGHASDAHIRVGEHMSEVTPHVPTHNIHGHAFDAHIRVGEHMSEVTTHVPTPNIHGHASDALKRVGEDDCEVSSPFPTRNIHGHASDAHTRVGEHMSEETTHVPTPNIHGHASDAHIIVGGHMSEETTHVPTPNIDGHASDAHIRVGEHMSEETTHVPTPNIHGHASDAHIIVGGHMSEETAHVPTHNIYGHASDAHIKVGEHMSEETTHVPTPNIHGHASDAHIRVGEHMSEETTHVPTPNIHGHASDAHIIVGGHMSEETTHVPTPNIHGHASDAHIIVGGHMSEETTHVPTPNIHGHASDAHIRVGEHMSEETTHVPTPNIHGHASDAHIIVGGHMSEETAHVPTPNIHGHASDAHIKVGEFVFDVATSRPRWSKYGHSSDSTLKAGCTIPENAPSPTPLPGSAYGHSSDSMLSSGCVVTGVHPHPPPLPGSEYGHSSQSTLGVGCVVGGVDITQAKSFPRNIHGHSSDTTLGMGCRVGGVVPGSLYGEKASNRSDQLLDETEKQAWMDTEESPEDRYLLGLASQYQVEQYQDSYGLMSADPESELLQQVTRGPNGLPVDLSLQRATEATAVQLSEMMPLPVLMKHSVTTPLITHVSMVNKAVVDYFFVELGVEKHFETLRHFLLMEDGEFALSLSDQLFEKLGSGQTPGELLTPLVLNSILNKALQYSVHGDSKLAAHFTFALRYLPEIFHPHAPDSLNCLELRYKVDWPVNIVITESCLNKYNRLFSFLLQLKHMVWSLRDVWFHLKRTALVKGAGRSVQFHHLQLYRHEMQHFVKVIQGYIANQILQVSWSEFTHKLSGASDLDAIHRTHAEYLNRAIFRGLLTEKAAPVMNIIHSIFSLILKFRGQLIAQPWELQQGEPVHPGFIAMQQSYNTFKYYSSFLFKVVSKLVDKGYQPHLEDFLLRINLNNYYKDS